MTNYTTIQGDLWDVISLRVYKTEKLMHKLIEANPKYREVVVFPANRVLNVPEISTEEKIAFPPWRRNA